MVCTLLPCFEISTAHSPLWESGRIIGLRRGERYSPQCFSANALHPSRLKDVPRQGYISVQIFERGKPLFGYHFSSGDEGLFYDTIFLKKPLFPFARKRRAMTGFYKSTVFYEKAVVIVCFNTCLDGLYKRTILDVGARKRIQQSASQ